MALRDHSLDEKITKAAREEFLKFGFHKASLHKIAASAGITTGALYTRYKGKDDLFCSLLDDLLKSVKEKSESMRDHYYSVLSEGSPEAVLSVIKMEEEVYLDLLFQHYEDCLLLFCKSDGSTIQENVRKMMDMKSKSTVEYLKTFSKKDVNLDGIEIIMNEQFRFFRDILEKGYDKEKAVFCLRNIQNFLDAGWKDLFERML